VRVRQACGSGVAAHDVGDIGVSACLARFYAFNYAT